MKARLFLIFILLPVLTSASKSPYAELMPWVPEEVWEVPFMEMDEFLHKYGIPRNGSESPDLEVFNRRREFNEKFFGLIVDNTKFAVIDRNDRDRNLHYIYYTLRDLYGRQISLRIRVFMTEQESLNVYPSVYQLLSMHRNYYIVYGERIPWGTFCRRFMNERGGLLDFVNGGLGVWMSIQASKAVDLLPAGKEIDALFRGKSEFLPENDPELVAIRNAHAEELARKKQLEDLKQELRKKKEREEKIQKALARRVKPEQERDAYKKLETRFELLKNHLKPKSVPAGMHDPDAWKKLSPKTISPLFRKYKSRVRDDTPLTPEFGVWRTDAEIKKTKPNGIHYDVEIAHAKTFEDAWDWALYFRLKYSEDTEQRARLTMKQLARATHRDAFPNLGDLNISWRGRMTSSFYPEEKSAESLIIFIRGTTTVCVRSHHTDSSALPLARLLDKQLLEGDASRPVEFYLPENF